MKRKVVYGILVFIFLLTLGTRLFFAFGAESTSFDSYGHLRQVEHIGTTGLPLYDDPDSYGGRQVAFPPLFYYVLGSTTSLLDVDFTARFLPNLFISLLVFVVFGISRSISRDDPAALFSAFIVGFLPVSYSTEPLLGVSPVSMTVLLSFLALWALLKADRWSIYLFVGLVFLLSLTHASSAIIIGGLILFLIMSAVDNTALSKEEFEALLLSFLLFIWVQFLFYKKAILLHGLDFFAQNVPGQISSAYFSGISLFSALFGLGFLPLLGGLYVVYKFVFKLRRRKMSLIIAVIIAVTLSLWLRLITPVTGFLFLGVAFSITFAQLYAVFFRYLRRTKIARFKALVFLGVLLLFIVNSVIPSLVTANIAKEKVPSASELAAYQWLHEMGDEGAVVLASLGEGHLITSVAQKKNVIDNHFLFSSDAQERFIDIGAIYNESSVIEAVRILDKYNVQYIVLSELARETHQIEHLDFINEREVCFIPAYDNQTLIYELRCHYQEVRRS